MKPYTFDVVPMGAKRMTQNNFWKKSNQLYFKYKDTIRSQAEDMGFELPEILRITFFMPIPQSWSQKRKQAMLNKPHQQTPDIDNLIKGFMDAFSSRDKTGSGKFRGDDKAVWYVMARKFWAEEGRIEVEIVQ